MKTFLIYFLTTLLSSSTPTAVTEVSAEEIISAIASDDYLFIENALSQKSIHPNDDRAFVRPSPSSGSLGGVARKTRETMLLCEAAGFDVGRSERIAEDKWLKLAVNLRGTMMAIATEMPKA